MILHYFGIVNAQIIHEHICLSFDFVHQLRDEIREGLGVVALLNNAIMDKALFFTDSPYHCHSSTSTIGLSKCHVLL